ncbi:MAG: LytTR family DNA-binding domain-containing protein [Gammaproteobacteria bacterium]
MTKIRVFIADDERHARNGIVSLLAAEGDVEVVGHASNGMHAIAGIRQQRPDLVFLDVEMPGKSGIEVVAEVGPDEMPMVIFITAFDQYAVAAFEANAIDYVLKPFSDERFHEAFARARERLDLPATRGFTERLKRMLDTVGEQQRGISRFTVRTGDVLSVFKIDDIDWIEADVYYAKLHIGEAVHLIRESLRALEGMLPPDRFVRIHRGTIVNLDRIVALEPMFKGDFSVILADGTRLRMSRRRRELLAGALTNFS